MLGRRMTLKDKQQMVCDGIRKELQIEWREWDASQSDHAISLIVTHKDQDLMEELFGSRFIHLANLLVDSQTLLSDIEDIDAA